MTPTSSQNWNAEYPTEAEPSCRVRFNLKRVSSPHPPTTHIHTHTRCLSPPLTVAHQSARPSPSRSGPSPQHAMPGHIPSPEARDFSAPGRCGGFSSALSNPFCPKAQHHQHSLHQTRLQSSGCECGGGGGAGSSWARHPGTEFNCHLVVKQQSKSLKFRECVSH